MIGAFLVLQLVAPAVYTKPLSGKGVIRDSSTNYIVLHSDESPSYAATRKTLIRRGNSYHYYIQRNGDIIKLLDPKYVGGHAGRSFYDGLSQLNFYSIGICLQDLKLASFTENQYKSLAWLIAALQKRYNDESSRVILTHSQIAIPRGRKKDPNGFDLSELNKYLIDWTQLHQSEYLP